MELKDKLQIILITYNRLARFKRTFECLLGEDSPVKDFNILILDNRSTDGTGEYAALLAEQHPNITHVRNRHNIGGCGNIAAAFYQASMEYVWVLADDDEYDFSNWLELDGAVSAGEEVILVARHNITEEHREKSEYHILQAAFLPSGVYKTSLLNDTLMTNIFDNIYTLFPHLCVIIEFINRGRARPFVLERSLVSPAEHGANLNALNRGVEVNARHPLNRFMSFSEGYSKALYALKDNALRRRALRVLGTFKAGAELANTARVSPFGGRHLESYAAGLSLGGKVSAYAGYILGRIVPRPYMFLLKILYFRERDKNKERSALVSLEHMEESFHKRAALKILKFSARWQK